MKEPEDGGSDSRVEDNEGGRNEPNDSSDVRALDQGENSETDSGEGIDDRIREGVNTLDNNLIDLLAGFMETETRAKVYLYIRKRGEATSDEIAEDTGLYPSTVRETLSDLYSEDIVDRYKKETEGAGNNPYVYEAKPPRELANRFSERLEERLNKLFNLDLHLEEDLKTELNTDWSPFRIVIERTEEEAEE